MRLYLIRHGQSFNNFIWLENESDKGRSHDPELTEKGFAQAHRVAEFLRDELGARLPLGSRYEDDRRPSILYTSLMTRAVATGHIIANALNVPLLGLTEAFETGGLYNKVEETGERHGVEGPNRAHFELHYPGLALPEHVGEVGWYNRPAETEEGRPERASQVWNELLNRHGGTDDVLGLITHGGFYNYLLTVILQFPPQQRLWFNLNNCAISRIDVTAHGTALVYLNRFDFFPPELVSL